MSRRKDSSGSYSHDALASPQEISLSDWNTPVIEEFRANRGQVVEYCDTPLAILHAVGARSGRTYEVPLVAVADGDRLVVFASNSGAPTHPHWYHNLRAYPRIVIEYGAERFEVDVTELRGEERARCLAMRIEQTPRFGEYPTRAAPRIIPALALTRVRRYSKVAAR